MSDLADYTGQSCDWYDLPCHATGFAEWLFDVALYIPRKSFELLTDALASTIEAIPPLEASSTAVTALSAISDAGYVAGLVALQEGIGLVLATLLLRFLLRRIPLIG
jgi:hypothetical protein